MDTLRNIFASFRLPIPIPTPPRLSLTLPCEITTEFFWGCGHTVTRRRCRNAARIWRDGIYHDPALACNDTCRTRQLPIVMQTHYECPWCRWGRRPIITDAVRSDPSQDLLEPEERERRRSLHAARWQRMTDGALRAGLIRTAGDREFWETYKRVEHLFADRQGYNFVARTYFLGEGRDEHLYIPIDRSSFPEGEGEGQTCVICRTSLWEGDMPIRLPCHAAHHFHTNCIDGWLPVYSTCPHCRVKFDLFTYQEWKLLHEQRPWTHFFYAPLPVPGERDDSRQLIRRQGIEEWDPAIESEGIDEAWRDFVAQGFHNF